MTLAPKAKTAQVRAVPARPRSPFAFHEPPYTRIGITTAVVPWALSIRTGSTSPDTGS